MYGAKHSDGPDGWIKICMEDIGLGLLTLWRLPASHWLGFCTARTGLSILTHLHQALNPKRMGTYARVYSDTEPHPCLSGPSSIPSLWYKTSRYSHLLRYLFSRSVLCKFLIPALEEALPSCFSSGSAKSPIPWPRASRPFGWLGGYTNFRSFYFPVPVSSVP